MQPPQLFDPVALAKKRARARRMPKPALFLHDWTVDQISERLNEVNKSFTDVGIVTAFGAPWSDLFPTATVVDEADILDFAQQKFDLILHVLSLHASNDPVGQMIQCRRALRKDGLFIAVLFGGNTLHELRASLGQAEIDLTGGLSPRVVPMAELRDLGGLLQRAEFALPVADSNVVPVSYSSALSLMADLRAMGETNVQIERLKSFTRRSIVSATVENYAKNFALDDGKVAATFEIITLTGWAPSENQPKPLRPGSAKSRLADALGTVEQTDFAAPSKLDP